MAVLTSKMAVLTSKMAVFNQKWQNNHSNINTLSNLPPFLK